MTLYSYRRCFRILTLANGMSSPIASSVLDFEYRGNPLTRKRSPLGPYRRPMPRVLGGSSGGGRFLMGGIPLYPYRRCFLLGILELANDIGSPMSSLPSGSASTW